MAQPTVSLLIVVLLSACLLVGNGLRADPALETREPVAQAKAAPDVPAKASYAQRIRVRVLEVTPVERIEKTQILKLQVERFYGKIDSKSLARAKEHETQRFTILFPAALDADIKPGDLIDYKLVGYMKIGRE